MEDIKRVIFDECLLGKTSFTLVRKLSLLSFLKSTISSKTTKTTFPSSEGKIEMIGYRCATDGLVMSYYEPVILSESAGRNKCRRCGIGRSRFLLLPRSHELLGRF